MRRNVIISAALGSLLFFGAGCVTIGTGPAGGADGGLFKSSDSGDTWQQKTVLATPGAEVRSFASASVATIVQDPQDPQAIYVGTTENGMFYSYDGGQSWNQPVNISRGRVRSIAVNPNDKCEIYATSGNRVLKSSDCSRDWDEAFIDTRTDREMTAIVVDHFNPSIVWAAKNSGELLRSADGGKYWASVRNFGNEIIRLSMRPDDSRKLYVSTKNNGIWRTDDGGQNWIDLSEQYAKDHSGSKDFFDIALGESSPDTMVFASKYGLLRSTDGGDTWQEISLLNPPGQITIYSLTLDPKDADIIYYGTSTTINRSPNGGTNWIAKKLPTSRAATALLVDSSSSTVLYMGVTKFK